MAGCNKPFFPTFHFFLTNAIYGYRSTFSFTGAAPLSEYTHLALRGVTQCNIHRFKVTIEIWTHYLRVKLEWYVIEIVNNMDNIVATKLIWFVLF